MVWTPDANWTPTRLLQVAGSVDSSTGATEVETDAGRAFIKPLGNRQGPHVLATDWVGTHLAKWFGLKTFDVAILQLTDEDQFPLPRGYRACPGPAFAARAIPGEPWGQSNLQLDIVINRYDITRLVVFDTWTLNCDRHHYDPTARKPNPDNIFLTSEKVPSGKRVLIAIDHGLCFISSGEELTKRLADIQKVKDSNLYGVFPEFRSKLHQITIEECVRRLQDMDIATAEAIVNSIPVEWEVSQEVRAAWVDLIVRRAGFVSENIEGWFERSVPWFGGSGENS